jgi:hypothetical protein
MGWLSALYGFLGGAAGMLVILFAGSRWLGSFLLARSQHKWADELEKWKNTAQQEQKRIQARIDSSVYVTRAHFETEFSAMKELFGLLSTTKLLLPIPRASLRISPSNETDKERKEQLNLDHGKLVDAYNLLLRQAEALSPFVTLELYQSVDQCTTVLCRELRQIQIANEQAFTQKWYVEGTKNQDEFLRHYKSVSDIIRARIASLAVIPAS